MVPLVEGACRLGSGWGAVRWGFGGGVIFGVSLFDLKKMGEAMLVVLA